MVISTEHDFTENSEQYDFILESFASVDRSTTPWLIVAGHRYTHTHTHTHTQNALVWTKYNQHDQYVWLEPVTPVYIPSVVLKIVWLPLRWICRLIRPIYKSKNVWHLAIKDVVWGHCLEVSTSATHTPTHTHTHTHTHTPTPTPTHTHYRHVRGI